MPASTDETVLSLLTSDGVRLSACYLPAEGDTDLAIVMAHGFSGTWSNPRSLNIATVLRGYGAVILLDFRGHGRSEGLSTVGDQEVLDIEAAVELARRRGHRRIAVVGFSMGAAVAVRHAALFDGVVAVAEVSGPAHWYYRGTPSMRWLHHAVEHRIGRFASRWALHTRISPLGWNPIPLAPYELAHKIAPTPLLIVHGTNDRFFPLRHAYALFDAAAEPRELWIEPGMGHAESAMTPILVNRLGRWLVEAATDGSVLPAA